MAVLEVHALGYERTLKLSAESKAERVCAHLDQISMKTQLQIGPGCGRGGRGPQLHASSYSLAQGLHLEKTRRLSYLTGLGNRAMCSFRHL